MDKLGNEWMEIDRIVLYGWGNIGKKCFSKFAEDFDIISIIDNDPEKHGEFRGIRITDVASSLDIVKSNKVVVMTGGKAYKNIANGLIKNGLKEFIDFCSIEVFISEWYWEKKGKNCLLEVHTAITMRCTFNCKNCNMFVPYYKKNIEYSFEELRQMYDLFFSYVDYVFCISILGGEPFFSPVLGDIIDYLGKTYSDKIGVLNIISNGSIMPDNRTLKTLASNHVLVYLSNYSAVIPYNSRFMKIAEKLKENDIDCVVRTSEEWKDFGFPVSAPAINSGDMKSHMNFCAPIFHGLNDNKFYYCHVAWSAEKAELCKLETQDYIDLNNLALSDKRKIVMHALGKMKKGYVSLCKACGGCGEDNHCIVKAAIQME